MSQAGSWALVDLSGNTNEIGLVTAGAEVKVKVAGFFLPASQISITYGLNDIPTASAQIALGRDARTQSDSSVYKIVNLIKQMAEAEILVSGALGDFDTSGTGGVRKQFPQAKVQQKAQEAREKDLGKDAVIFKGYVSGLTYRRSAGRVTMIVNFVNKLFDLSVSSGGSKDVVPGAPHSFMQGILEAGPGGTYYTTAETKLSQDLPPLLERNFSNAILESLHWIASNNQLQTHDQGIWCKNVVTGPISLIEANNRALNVIEQFGTWEGIATFSSSRYMAPYASACPLLLFSNGYQLASKVISSQIGNSIAATSMWGTLIYSVLPGFGAGIIPMARGAILAPVLPMARKHQATIFPGDYADFNLSAQSQRPLYGVGVMANYIMGTLTDKDPKQCVGAAFVASAKNGPPVTDGMWLFVNAPPWLEDFANFDPKAVTGDADVTKVLNDVSHDAVGVNDIAVDRDIGSEVPEWNTGMSKYAQMMYATQALRGREGTLVGKLRFDIAPGTTILISAKGNQLSAGVDTLATDMLGFVARVTISINAEQASAVTTFELTNLRTAKENETDRFSLDEHPFFGQNYFKYAPIVPELSLPPVVS